MLLHMLFYMLCPLLPSRSKRSVRQIYFEAFDLVVNCVQRRFDQPDFQTYVHLQEVFLKTIKGKLRSKHFSLKKYPLDMYLSENVNSLKKNQFTRQKNS